MVNPFDIYPPVTLEKYPFLKENKYFEYVINLTPNKRIWKKQYCNFRLYV